jgi:hypothetical protein
MPVGNDNQRDDGGNTGWFNGIEEIKLIEPKPLTEKEMQETIAAYKAYYDLK